MWEKWSNNAKIFSITKKIETIYCVIYGKHRKFEKPKILYPWRKTFVVSIFWSKYKNEGEKILKEEKSIEILKILGLIQYI